MPADVKATTIVTLAQAREWVHGDAAEASKDAVLIPCTDAASDRLERWTSRYFKRRNVVETVDVAIGGLGRALFLKFAPVIIVNSITVDGVVLDPSFYALDSKLGRVLLKNGMQFSNETIVANYDAGYADADLPADAVETALELTKRLYRLKTSGGGVFQTVSVGNSSFIVRDRLPDDVKDAIERLSDKRFG